MKLMKYFTVFLSLAICMMSGLAVQAQRATNGSEHKIEFGTSPTTNNGKKWRIVYYEGGEYIDYQKIFAETIKGLMKSGWIEVSELPQLEGEQTSGLWEWLAKTAKSDYLEFLVDGHYSAAWDDALADETAAKILKRLKGKNDVDLVIAMGTRAGQDLANDRHSTPTLVLSASDPLASGIIKSVEDSGLDHVNATVDPFRYERQVRVFHEIIGFHKLGVPYEDSVNGRSYAAIDVVEKVAAERGFEIVRCHTRTDITDAEEAEATVVKCFEELSGKVDAIYVTVQQGVNARSIPKLVAIANAHHIPTFSQSGSEEVKLGFLLSISQAGFRYVGEFHAKTVGQVLNGAKPNDLDQLFEEPPKIALNLQTAESIDFDPPVIILGAADEIF